MANPEHLALFQQGAAVWNEWRMSNPGSFPDLSRADLKRKFNLHGANLSAANLSGADLTGTILSREESLANLSKANLEGANLLAATLIGADLRGANLSKANLERANLSEARLGEANLVGANLEGANLFAANLSGATLNGANLKEACLVGAQIISALIIEANLSRATLIGAVLDNTNFYKANLSKAVLDHARLRLTNLSNADLSGASLNESILIGTDIGGAILTGSSIYGIAAWDVKLTSDTRQENLIITPLGEPAITVDNIKVAQFIYLLLKNEEVRDVIDTITSKAVLILGRFSPERKIILDRLREELRSRDYLPIMFDFEKTKSRDTIETIRTLAGMSKFIIADLTEAKAVVQELQAIVPNLPSVPVRFIIKKSEREPSMFDHIRRFPWVLDGAFEYETTEEVVAAINDSILKPLEAKLKELAR